MHVTDRSGSALLHVMSHANVVRSSGCLPELYYMAELVVSKIIYHLFTIFIPQEKHLTINHSLFTIIKYQNRDMRKRSVVQFTVLVSEAAPHAVLGLRF